MESTPKPGITIKAEVIEVKDGDTVKVRLVRDFDVRIIHPNNLGYEFNAPEKSTVEGKICKTELENKIKGLQVTIFIPTHDNNNLVDINSFNRLLGMVWLGDELVSSWMLDNDLAKLYKKGTY